MNRPINLDTSDWGLFDPNHSGDLACERERTAFTQYTLKRLKKIEKTQTDEAAILIGGIMAIVQIIFAMNSNNPPDQARDRMHDILDFAWLQCAGMALGKAEMQ